MRTSKRRDWKPALSRDFRWPVRQPPFETSAFAHMFCVPTAETALTTRAHHSGEGNSQGNPRKDIRIPPHTIYYHSLQGGKG